ncbi:hypothetical protein CXG81DRAFT_19463 [Caulochytrium protostelioides]|uniref:MYND-type domain-containing protein n=1 Tax=Caulochytrium protostelioides TaxID=1555241 RepID=A0A4P9X631_9FUNG|nr:hypothetical protein CXG81DRAFT_19463 [Caulochytrium protostelioides]|eukprot:RKP00624.1 hypothetical protein CXG81DRAFT_19463 [Caulochytrium protostelioides]
MPFVPFQPLARPKAPAAASAALTGHLVASHAAVHAHPRPAAPAGATRGGAPDRHGVAPPLGAPTCELCARPATLTCASCAVAFWCDRDHARLDDALHQRLCRSIAVLRGGRVASPPPPAHAAADADVDADADADADAKLVSTDGDDAGRDDDAGGALPRALRFARPRDRPDRGDGAGPGAPHRIGSTGSRRRAADGAPGGASTTARAERDAAQRRALRTAHATASREAVRAARRRDWAVALAAASHALAFTTSTAGVAATAGPGAPAARLTAGTGLGALVLSTWGRDAALRHVAVAWLAILEAHLGLGNVDEAAACLPLVAVAARRAGAVGAGLDVGAAVMAVSSASASAAPRGSIGGSAGGSDIVSGLGSPARTAASSAGASAVPSGAASSSSSSSLSSGPASVAPPTRGHSPAHGGPPAAGAAAGASATAAARPNATLAMGLAALGMAASTPAIPVDPSLTSWWHALVARLHVCRGDHAAAVQDYAKSIFWAAKRDAQRALERPPLDASPWLGLGPEAVPAASTASLASHTDARGRLPPAPPSPPPAGLLPFPDSVDALAAAADADASDADGGGAMDDDRTRPAPYAELARALRAAGRPAAADACEVGMAGLMGAPGRVAEAAGAAGTSALGRSALGVQVGA